MLRAHGSPPLLLELESRLVPAVVELVADINQASPPSNPAFYTVAGATAYFITNASGTVRDLWRSDGTSAGTVLVRSFVGELGTEFCAVGDTLFFRANDGIAGFELWKTDGTSSGTVLVHDINEGPTSSMPEELTAVGNSVFFRALTEGPGKELWVSDGTSSGTRLLRDIQPGASSGNPKYLTHVSGQLFFSAADALSNYELWASDGTSSGTRLVRDIRPGPDFSGNPSFFFNANGLLFFTSSEDGNTPSIWRSDGTSAGTVSVRPPDASPSPRGGHSFAMLGGVTYFRANKQMYGLYYLWRSDGTSAGTSQVSDLPLRNTQEITAADGLLYFMVNSGFGGPGFELYRSDGTSSGTGLLRDINTTPPTESFSSYPIFITNFNGVALFSANDGRFGNEPWRSDGTASGTKLVRDVVPGNKSADLFSIKASGTSALFAANDGVLGPELWRADSSGASLVRDIAEYASIGSLPFGFSEWNGVSYFDANDGSGWELWRTDGTSAGTYLVRDINPGTAGIGNGTLTNINGVVFFAAENPASGEELWRSDGTSSGTFLVRDINPGSGNSSPGEMTELNGMLLFRANNGLTGTELWRSNGTSTGTSMVRDIFPGSVSGLYPYLQNGGRSWFTNVGGTLFFYASTPSERFELWKSNGTSTGTVLVRDIAPGQAQSMGNNLTNVNSTLFFRANNGTNGYELWKSNGTSSGTVLVRDIITGAANGLGFNANRECFLTNHNGTLFFRAIVDSQGFELWKSDGTSVGTILVRDINPGVSDSYPASLFPFNGLLYFSAVNSNGRELWRSDGSSSGTSLVYDIATGPTSSLDPASITDQHPFFTIFGSTLFFRANDGTVGNELWKTDGTSTGTTLVRDIRPGFEGSNPTHLCIAGGRLFFSATDANLSRELWSSDGSSGGTALVAEIDLGSASSNPSLPTSFNGAIYFTANDGFRGTELWRTDGTATALFADLLPGVSASNPDQLTVLNGALYFNAISPNFGNELWRSDGTSAGTNVVRDIWAGGSASNPNNIISVNGLLFFAAASNPGGTSIGIELWRSNGTSSGTVLVRDINTGANNSSVPHSLTEMNGTLYFVASNSEFGQELWRSDGTSSGTAVVRDILPGPGSVSPGNLINVNGILYFMADDGAAGRELWRSDGTSSGTLMVRDIQPGPGSSFTNSNYPEFTNVSGTLFFTANGGDATGIELWKSNGTSTGTVLVRDVAPGFQGGLAAGGTNYFGNIRASLTNVNGLLYFSAANSNTTRAELWKSNGTSTGTVLISDINPGGSASAPLDLTNMNGTLYFSANTPATGREIWRSNGTSTGTVRLTSLLTGPDESGDLRAISGSIYFRANDGFTGRELWAVDTPPVLLSLTATGPNGRTANLLNLGGLTLPWSVNSIQATFSEPVTGAVGSLLLNAIGLPSYSLSGSGTLTLSWTFAIPAEQIRSATLRAAGPDAIIGSLGIGLDGNNDYSGGDDLVLLGVRVLAGDYDGDGNVDAIDLSLIRALVVGGQYSVRADFDNDGDVDFTDLNFARVRTGRTLALMEFDFDTNDLQKV